MIDINMLDMTRSYQWQQNYLDHPSFRWRTQSFDNERILDFHHHIDLAF
jgi:hypothetical protein